jgi:hypothetical protein
MTLLDMLSIENKTSWNQEEEYRLAWSTMQAWVVTWYIQQFNTYCKKYLQSPAGKLFTQAVHKARNGGKKLPTLDENSIVAFEGAAGISWTVEEIGDIFCILMAVTHTDDVTETCGVDEVSLKFSKSNCAQALGDGEWFMFDLDNHKNGRETWFDHLSAAANATLVQWIRINSGFRQAGNVAVEMNHESYSRLLMRIPTAPFAQDTYPQFEIESQSLKRWCETIKNDDSEFEQFQKPDIVLHHLRKDAESLQETPFPLPPAQLSLAIHDGNTAGQAVSQSIKDAISTMPTPQFHQRSLDPTRVAPAPQYCPELTTTDLAWINGNSVSKVKITIMIAKQELDAWKLFASTSSVQIAKWEESIGELEEMCKLLEDAHGTSARFDEFAQERTEKEKRLSAQVATAKQHPYTARYLERKIAEHQKTPTPTLGAQRYVPSSCLLAQALSGRDIGVAVLQNLHLRPRPLVVSTVTNLHR